MVANTLFAVEFFQLQLFFAAKVAEVGGMPLTEAVENYTNIFVRLGMGTHFNTGNPEWEAFINGLVGARDRASYAHSVHRNRLHLPVGTLPERIEGCFSYALADPGFVRLHFKCGDHGPESPLSLASRPTRLAELAMLLSHLRADAGESVSVVGASWLYNLSSYRSLFPAPYVSGLRAVKHPYQRMPLWGQFVKRDGSVRPEAGRSFLAHVAQAATLAELAACFPLPVLATSAPVSCFVRAQASELQSSLHGA